MRHTRRSKRATRRRMPKSRRSRKKGGGWKHKISKSFNKYFNPGKYDISHREKKEAMEALKKKLKRQAEKKQYDPDGFQVDLSHPGYYHVDLNRTAR